MKLRIPEEALRELYVEQGLSGPQIARIYKVSKTTVSCNLKELQIPRRSTSEAIKLKWKKDQAYRKKLKLHLNTIWKRFPHPRGTLGKPAWNKGLKGIHLSPKTEIKKGQHLSAKTELKKGLIPKSRKLFLSKQEFEELYLIDKMGTPEIASRLGIKCGSTILKWLKEYGVPIRSPAEARKLAVLQGRVKMYPPTKPEMKFLKLCEDQDIPFRYTGDGGFWVGYPPMNPDFIHTNGQKIAVEIFGDYWHRNDDPQQRINAFKKYGWKCMVFWEHEIKNEEFGMKFEDALKKIGAL